MNKRVFFDAVRKSIFGGALSQLQVEGMDKIIDYRDTSYRGVTNDQLAYVMATVYWETAHTMQPVTEYGSQAYLRGKKYYPWIGRGLVQLTWEVNFRKFKIAKPEDALLWPNALYICFKGMVEGIFTGKKLSDYINANKRDYINARRIINGTDKAREIAAIANKFRTAIIEAAKVPAEPHEQVVATHVEEKGIADTIGDFLDWTRHPEEVQQAPGTYSPAAPTLKGQSGYILAAIIAAVAALNNIDSAEWARTVSDPGGHLPMIATAIAIAVANAILPAWVRWLLPKAPRL